MHFEVRFIINVPMIGRGRDNYCCKQPRRMSTCDQHRQSFYTPLKPITSTNVRNRFLLIALIDSETAKRDSNDAECNLQPH